MLQNDLKKVKFSSHKREQLDQSFSKTIKINYSFWQYFINLKF